MNIDRIETTFKGEFPINWRIDTFPRDAGLVLKIRAASRKYQKEHHITGPVVHLQAEQALMDISPEFARLHNEVNQPITFALQDTILRVLSFF